MRRALNGINKTGTDSKLCEIKPKFLTCALLPSL